MTRFLLKDVLGWGVALWLFGYLLGFVFFGLVPVTSIGWCVMPFGIAATVLVLWRWVRLPTWRHALLLGIGWALLAVVLDYVGIVKLLAPPEGYYRLDVYLYYALTLLLPLAVKLVKH